MPNNAEFLRNPLMFLRLHAVSPPGGTPRGILKTWKVENEGQILAGGDSGKTTELAAMSAGVSVQFATIAPHPLLPEALTLRLSPNRQNPDQIPIHWLPWASLRICQTSIPEVPRNLVEADEEENPRFFFTAGLSGCSVFIKGPATRPTVYHAGIEGKLANAVEFWRQQLEVATSGRFFDVAAVAEANKTEYMDEHSQTVRDYITWAQGPGSMGQPFTVNLQSCFACVFGIRFGHYWSFYLQQCGLIETAKFITRQEVATDENGRSTEQGTGFRVTERVTSTPRRFLPAKKTRIYASTNKRCINFGVREIFPNRYWSGQLKDRIHAHQM